MFFPLKFIKAVPKMSFPPGPPLPLPGMPVPPMLPPPYAVPPMGMIPMTVGMMPGPMMAPVAMTMPAPIPMPQPQKYIKKINPPMYKKYENHVEQEVPKGPPVTVFVGNITDRAPDNLVRQILQRCGIVLNWKRVQGANGKLQAFGFCEYGDPESALRAMRLLHDYELGEKKLVVKVDAKTKEKLDEYKATKLAKTQDDGKKEDKEADDNNKEEGEASDDALDEMTKQRDNAIITSLQSLISAHSAELNRPNEEKEESSPVSVSTQPEKTHNSEQNSPRPRIDYERLKKNELDEMDLEEDKKSLIHREIDKFRDTYKRAEEERDKDKDRRPRRREYESPEPRSRVRDRERERDRDRRSLEREERSRRRRSRERSERDRKRESPRESPVVSRRRDRSAERQIDRPRSRSRERNDWRSERDRDQVEEKPKEKEFDKDDEDDAYEKKKQDRKIREKEAIYQDRLRNWIVRERRKLKEYEKEKMKSEEQRKDESKEARRLKEFLEDYDDEKDDPKYFKGSALVRRMKEREKEIEEDMIDRQKEKEELDELRKKLVEEGHPDPDAEVERLLLEESRLMDPPKPETPESEPEQEIIQPSPIKMRPVPKVISSPPEEIEEKIPMKRLERERVMVEEEISQNSFSGFSDVIAQPEEPKLMGFTSLRLGGSPTHNNTGHTTNNNHIPHKRKSTVDDVFNVNDEETETKKKRKLIPIDDQQEDGPKSPHSVSQMTLEEKRKHIKNLIEKIPTEKIELFAYSLDWTVVDKVLMEKRIRPWINKKIVEYIGEEEPTLVEFICSKIMAGSAAQSILDDVSMVLDEEAEVFVVKMWRLLIYEIEAKKLGLVCKTDSAQENASQGKT
ncbi:RNA-binding protein 25 isoform X4 [Parasteatoda tepidariorum]|uniref:RNA-binding protein 25 isoform X4 n=2 Tax=Parasteatoda tepidariorum TaxID=114398 RepID=UPI00077FE1B1|nr:RNA-binding protein 25 isoform X2 [Parasteatoda tepidariorum]